MSTFPAVVEHLPLWPTAQMDQPLLGVLSYQADDPYAVRLAFVDPDGSETPCVYAFAPELLTRALAEGLDEPVSDGEVWIAPTELAERMALSLFAPDLLAESGGRFELLVERARLQAIAEQVARVCELAGLAVGS
jgi:hypothetical protein